MIENVQQQLQLGARQGKALGEAGMSVPGRLLPPSGRIVCCCLIAQVGSFETEQLIEFRLAWMCRDRRARAQLSTMLRVRLWCGRAGSGAGASGSTTATSAVAGAQQARMRSACAAPAAGSSSSLASLSDEAS